MHAIDSAKSLHVYTGALCAASMMTALLLLLMYSLIATDTPMIDEQPTFRFDPIMPEREAPVVEKTEPPERVPDPEEVPEFETPSMELTPQQITTLASGTVPVAREVAAFGQVAVHIDIDLQQVQWCARSKIGRVISGRHANCDAGVSADVVNLSISLFPFVR